MAEHVENKEKRERAVQEIAAYCEKYGLSDEGHAEMLMVYGGVRRANFFLLVVVPFNDPRKDGITLKEKRERIDEAVEMLERIGFHVVLHGQESTSEGLLRNPKGEVETWESVFVDYSLSKKDAMRLSDLQKYNQVEDRAEIGVLLGYPETAARAYESWLRDPDAGNPMLLMSELPEEAQAEDCMAFVTMLFSKTHWREEVAHLRKWAEKIRELDPDLYANMVAKYHQRRLHSERESY